MSLSVGNHASIHWSKQMTTYNRTNRLHRDSSGQLPTYAWPGGYPIFYYTADEAVLCADCANGQNGSDASESSDDPQWQLTACDVNWEDDSLTCDHCNSAIESAYGEPEDK